MTTNTQTNQHVNGIKPIVKGLEDLMKVRIATGNRLAANFAVRNNMANSATDEKERAKLMKMYESIIEDLKLEHKRITDAVAKGDADEEMSRLPKLAKFKPTPLINSYSELVLVDQYKRLLNDEIVVEKHLVTALREHKLYTDYLAKVAGVGPKLAAVIISELDPFKAKYLSGYYVYSGLDTVVIGRYKNKKGEDCTLSEREIMGFYSEMDWNEALYVDGSLVTFDTVGRSRHKHCQVEHKYIDKDGKPAVRMGISFNPFLKTKLIGVLGPSFLKVAHTEVDGEKMSKEERIRMAAKLGFERSAKTDPMEHKKADAFLIEKGHEVQFVTNRFAKIYYAYKARLETSQKPTHQGLSAIQIHNRAIRYMVKEFLRELYIVSRHINNLPIYQSYEQAKLGYNHVKSEWLWEEFGIDTTKFIPWVDPKTVAEVADKYQYPKSIQAYLNERNQPNLVMA